MCHRIPPCRAHDVVETLLPSDIIDPFDSAGEGSDISHDGEDDPIWEDESNMKRAA